MSVFCSTKNIHLKRGFRPEFWVRSYCGEHGCHIHSFHQFLIGLDGHLDLYTTAGDFILTNDTGVIVSQNYTHEYLVPRTASILAVDVAAGVWAELENTICHTKGIRSIPVSQALADLLSEARCKANRPEVRWRPADRYLDAFSSAIASVFRPCNDDRITAALSQLEALHETTPSLNEVSAGVGLSPAHLSRLFNNHLGSSPARLARSRRLEHATQLLIWTDRPIATVAIACGYSDQATFTRAFTGRYGLPPGKLRAVRGQRRMQESAKNS